MIELLSFSPVEEILTPEHRANEIVAVAREQIPNYGWKGRALLEGGAINSTLRDLSNDRLPLLIKCLEEYEDEKGRKFFSGKEEVLDRVLTDLVLVYTWNLSRQYDNLEAFRGEKPPEWRQDYWKLAQAIACSHPNSANPCVQILRYASIGDKEKFRRCLEAGEEGKSSLVQSIEPEKMGLGIEDFPGKFSFRQALGQLMIWKSTGK